MSEKKRDVLFSILLIVVSGAVFFSLGFIAAQNHGFVQKKVVVETVSLEDTATKPLAFEGKININTATVEDLMQIEGIGEKTAQSIIDYRNKIGGYQYVEQLLYVNGIGETKFNNWSPFLTVGDESVTSTSSTTVGSGSTVATTTISSSTSVGKFNLNSVSLEELMTISGVGEKTAQSIIRYREQIGGFTTLEQLMDIDGIGEKRFILLCEYLTLDD